MGGSAAAPTGGETEVMMLEDSRISEPGTTVLDPTANHPDQDRYGPFFLGGGGGGGGGYSGCPRPFSCGTP